MPTLDTILVFAIAGLALLAIPGPSVLFIVTRSAVHGPRLGLAGMLGVQTGGLAHVLAASLGVSAIIASSATAFTAVKWAGAVYLVWLGIQRFRAGDCVGDPTTGRPTTARRLFRQGFLVNLLNPKTALFFLAVLPQFVDPARGSPWLQSMSLGVLFVAMAVVTDGAWALCAGWVSDRLRSRRSRRVERYATSGILVGLGVAAAFTKRG